MKCAVCVELSIGYEAPVSGWNPLLEEAITIIDGTAFCQKHAEMKIQARHQQALQQKEEMARLIQGIENMKVGE